MFATPQTIRRIAAAATTCSDLLLKPWKPMILGLVALMGFAGVAHAQVPSLPMLEAQTYSWGINPTLVIHSGEVRVHFYQNIDPRTDEWILWTPQTHSNELSGVPYSATTCSWGGLALFCSGRSREVGDFVYTKLLSSSSCPDMTYPLDGEPKINHADYELATVEMINNAIYRVELDISRCDLAFDEVRTASTVRGSPVLLSSGAVVYQERTTSADLVVRWDSLGANQWSTSRPMTPSDGDGRYAYVNTEASVQSVLIEPTFDPINRPLIPRNIFGCDTLQNAKVDQNLVLVHGLDCGGIGDSVLFAMTEHSQKPYVIGKLSATNPRYDIFARWNPSQGRYEHHIAFVDQNKDIVWILADSAAIFG